MSKYHIDIRIKSGSFPKEYVLNYQFDTLDEFKQGFLKRFGNIGGSKRAEQKRQYVKESVYNITSYQNILPWAQHITLNTSWSIKIIFIKENNGLEHYHIRNERM